MRVESFVMPTHYWFKQDQATYGIRWKLSGAFPGFQYLGPRSTALTNRLDLKDDSKKNKMER
jgi:hypothetical protein